MKKLLLAPLALSVAFSASSTEINVPYKADNVTVYNNGAKVSRVETLKLTAGRNVLIFENLSPYITNESISIRSLSTGINVLSISSRGSMDQDDAAVKKLKAELEAINLKIEDINLEISSINETVAYMTKAGDNPLDLKSAVETFQTKTSTLAKEKLSYNRQLKSLDKQKQDIQKNINKIAFTDNNRNEIVVELQASQTKDYNISLSYFIDNRVSWRRSYEVRTDGVGKPLNFIAKATVFQNSLEDWENVNLTVSTGDLISNRQLPFLDKYELSYLPAPASEMASDYVQECEYNVAASSLYGSRKTPNIISSKYNMGAAAYRNDGEIAIEYLVDTPQTILSTGRGEDTPSVSVAIEKHKLEVKYIYEAVPKLSNEAFLTATTILPEGNNLKSASAEIFYKDDYVGNCFVNNTGISDTLKLSLVPDSRIFIDRKLKDASNKTSFGKKEQMRLWNIELKNNATFAVDMCVKDQYPVSTNDKDIDITLISGGGAEVNKETGELKWTFKLAPNESKTLTFQYKVKAPIGKVDGVN